MFHQVLLISTAVIEIARVLKRARAREIFCLAVALLILFIRVKLFR